MKTVFDLNPELAVTPQCKAPVCEPWWAASYIAWRLADAEKKQYDSALCLRSSKYSIDGKTYCTMHAGKILLDEATCQNS